MSIPLVKYRNAFGNNTLECNSTTWTYFYDLTDYESRELCELVVFVRAASNHILGVGLDDRLVIEIDLANLALCLDAAGDFSSSKHLGMKLVNSGNDFAIRMDLGCARASNLKIGMKHRTGVGNLRLD